LTIYVFLKYDICHPLVSLQKQSEIMSKCEQCIVREFSALKALNKDELVKLADCKTSYTVKKGDVLFEEGDN